LLGPILAFSFNINSYFTMGRHKSKDSITTTRPSAKAKQIFAGKVFFLCGDVTVDVRFTKAAIERYIDQRGGKVAQQMSNDIDYLVCTIATFNEKPSPGLLEFYVVAFSLIC
jgi:NAD-dependent DNA ligase